MKRKPACAFESIAFDSTKTLRRFQISASINFRSVGSNAIGLVLSAFAEANALRFGIRERTAVVDINEGCGAVHSEFIMSTSMSITKGWWSFEGVCGLLLSKSACFLSIFIKFFNNS